MRAGSSLSKALTKQSMPRSIAAPIGNSSQSRISDFCRRIARGPAARIGRTKRSTASSSPSAGATASTSPHSNASRGADRLAGQQQPAGAARPDQFRQQCRLDHRRNADRDLGHAKDRAFAGDPQIAGGGKFEPGAERIAVDARDDWHRQPAKRVAAAMDEGNEAARGGVIEGGDLGYIGAADKGASAGAGQDREPQLGVKGEPGDGLDDLAHQRPIETIQLGPIVDRQPRDMAAFGPLLVFDNKAVCSHRPNRFECPPPARRRSAEQRPPRTACRLILAPAGKANGAFAASRA